jgi:hypothetical protein
MEDKTDPFLVAKRQIGLLTDSTQVKDLKIIYENDSISSFKTDKRFTGMTRDIHILNKAGEHLLTLSPRSSIDSTATINTVRIEDPRFVTKKGVGLNSTFGQIAEHYKINKIDNLLKTVVVSVNELNASFTIDKEELPANMRFDMNLSIDALQIPDEAKIKYFMLHW